MLKRLVEPERVIIFRVCWTDDHGDVAQYSVEKAMALGAKVVTVSDSSGTVIDEDGFTTKKLAVLMEVKNHLYGRVDDHAKRVGAKFEGRRAPLACGRRRNPAERNTKRVDAKDAVTLIKNGVVCVAEGVNMPSTSEAAKAFESAGVLYAPGKASNAGGVTTSGLEKSQNSARLSWPREVVDARLLQIMQSIHEACMRHGRRADATVSYVDGAKVAGFVKVADAMLAQALV